MMHTIRVASPRRQCRTSRPGSTTRALGGGGGLHDGAHSGHISTTHMGNNHSYSPRLYLFNVHGESNRNYVTAALDKAGQPEYLHNNYVTAGMWNPNPIIRAKLSAHISKQPPPPSPLKKWPGIQRHKALSTRPISSKSGVVLNKAVGRKMEK